MRNMLALIGLVVVVFFGVGWYRGWYSFEVQPTSDGKKRIQFDVDTTKIADDATEAKARIGQIANDPNAVGPPAPPTAPAKAEEPKNVAGTGAGLLPPAEVKIGGFRLQVSPDAAPAQK